MDNVTHSLFGAALGIALCNEWEERGKKIRRTLPIIASIGANNFPDLDIVYAPITQPLGFLLHHRGHTHTFLAAPLQGIIVYLLALLLAHIMKCALSSSERMLILSVSLIGTVVHILLDSLNSYGVHPFWPFDNRWYYGDILFIVEPWLWLLILPYLVRGIQSQRLRHLMVSFVVIAVALITLSGYVARSSQLIVLASSLSLAVVVARAHSLRRASLYLATALLALVTIFGLASRSVKHGVEETTRGGYTAIDVVASPSPASLFCWNYLLLQSSPSHLLITGGRVSLLSSSFCERYLPLSVARGEERSHSFDYGIFPGDVRESMEYPPLPLARLQEVARHCNVSAFLRFSRVPWLQEGGRALELYDIRFQRQGRENFASFRMRLDRGTCANFVPEWEYPRQELLSGRSAPQP